MHRDRRGEGQENTDLDFGSNFVLALWQSVFPSRGVFASENSFLFLATLVRRSEFTSSISSVFSWYSGFVTLLHSLLLREVLPHKRSEDHRTTMASTSTPDVPSIPVVFTTKTAYPLPSQKFMIPSTWRRYQLSQLINKALSLPRVVPFDFLIGGEVLKGSLEEKAAGEVRSKTFSQHCLEMEGSSKVFVIISLNRRRH